MPKNDFLNSSIGPLGYKKMWKKEKVDKKNNIWRLFFLPLESNDTFLEVRAFLGNKNKYILIKNYKNLSFNETHWGLELPIEWIFSFLKENSKSAFKINKDKLDERHADVAKDRFYKRGITASAYSFNRAYDLSEDKKAKEKKKAEKNRNKIVKENMIRLAKARKDEKSLLEKQNEKIIKEKIKIKKIPGYRKGAEICSRCGGDGGVRGGCIECDGAGWFSYEYS